MVKKEDVQLLCDPDSRALMPRKKRVYRDDWKEKKENITIIIILIILFILCLLLFNPTVVKLLRSCLGHSERESAPRKAVESESVIVMRNHFVSQFSSANDVNGQDSTEGPVTLKMPVDTEVENWLNYADEVEGLLSHIGEEMPHPDSVAFILPLRDHVGNQGVRFAKRLKEILEDARKAYELEIKLGNMTDRDTASSQPRDLLPILGNSSRVPPSHVLIRDSQGDSEIARQLTLHFYEIHGTTRFFGYLTDEEAMAAALWARVRAPGARFVTPTAISTYLDSAANVLRVQPSAKVLALALADLLVTLDLTRPLVVVRASLHTDAFLALLRPLGIKPSQVIHYYDTTNFEDLAEKIRMRVLDVMQPVLLLGDAESWEIIHIADSYYSCLWICPFPSQLHDHIRTTKSELIYFMYRAYDDKPTYPMKENTILEPNESIIKASVSLLSGKRRTWRGSYVVVASVATSSLKSKVKIFSATDLLPIMQYDVTRRGISRRIYYELQVTQQLLKPLTAGNQCQLVIIYLDELTGKLMRTETSVNLLQSTLIIPAGRGAQLHLDCPKHHVDLRCTSPKNMWSPIKCRGMIQGIHHYQSYCGNDVGVTFSATKGCLASSGLVCRDNQTLGCRLLDLCSSVSYSRLMYNCDGIPIDRL